MDPFLEVPPYWSDFSPAFLSSIRNQLLSVWLPRYDVRLEEYLLLEHDELPPHRVKPDVVLSTNEKSDQREHTPGRLLCLHWSMGTTPDVSNPRMGLAVRHTVDSRSALA
jgi:hypothetical protein